MVEGKVWLGVALLGLLAVPCFAQELAADGFPADYQPEDFAVGDAPAADAPIVLPAVSVTAVITPTGTRFRVEDLPRAGRSTATKPVAVEVPVDLPQPAQVAVEDLPRTAEQAARWGLVEVDGKGPWHGANRAQVETLLGNVEADVGRSVVSRSPAMMEILTQMLVARGVAPVDASATYVNWLGRRAQALEKIGEDEQAWRMWQALPPAVREANAELELGWTRAALVAGEVRTACDAVKNRLKTATGEARAPWQQALVACQLLDGQTEGARLSWQLAQDNAKAVPAAFRAIVEAWLAGDKLKQPFDVIDSFSASLLVARPEIMEETQAAGYVKRLPAVALRRLVNTGGLPLKLRLNAAENLASRSGEGADGQAVALLYQALSFNEDQQTDPVGNAAKMADSVAARALLWQAASGRGPVSLRASGYDYWRKRALSEGLRGLPEVMPVSLAGVPAEDASTWLGPVVAGDALRAGDTDNALEWMNKLGAESLMDGRLRVAVASGDKTVPDTLWKAALGKDKTAVCGDGGELGACARVAGVSDVMGQPVPDAVYARLLNGGMKGETPGVAPGELWRMGVEQAVRSGQTGVAVLMLVQPQLGEDPQASGWWRVRLGALRHLELEVASRRLAGEILAGGMAEVAEASRPALPTINGGAAPTVKARAIGGVPLKEAASKSVSASGMDGFILPPPRAR